ncbi:protein of unknown function DUF6 transmembrane [Thermaerobacter marianensis DSM 12885]|uniref:EamA domain-containing protein n=1 Tax=Thermaerobacter marianensis (strain ATCC 700841 / DSM 12885 / JCM 10246 / 7p75a) TaxID=644966 RepID=E6SHB1_THEM7|nr:DMT family transporter [Thermaerobacter marianensis]ADU50675.1 protein of unknown function DUF6 transmembrane [Thermaerobacter marianensis DSM 12885]
MALFSLTLPATRLALEALPPELVGPGRAAGAALAAALVAACAGFARGARGPGRADAPAGSGPRAAPEAAVTEGTAAAPGPGWLPPREDWPSVLLVAAGTVTAFPWLSTLALAQVPASHGAVLLGLLPLLTSGYATWRAGERPSARFWWAALTGSAVVVGFALHMGAGRLQHGDLWLLAAIVAAAAGHGEGGRLARRHGGFLPIAWGLWVALPVTLAAAGPALVHPGIAPPAGTYAGPGAAPRLGPASPPGPGIPAGSPVLPAWPAWLAWFYISVVTQFAAFVLWYRAMSLAGVARTSQLQLLQPFLTLLAARAGLGEALDPVTVLAAGAVALVVAVGRRAPVHRADEPACRPAPGSAPARPHEVTAASVPALPREEPPQR